MNTHPPNPSLLEKGLSASRERMTGIPQASVCVVYCLGVDGEWLLEMYS